jgi:hypothetical protein
MVSTAVTMITRGDSSVWIQKIYKYFHDRPFTYKRIAKRFPRFNRALITAMHNSKIIQLQNGNKRATGISKKNPTVWVFSSEALMILQRYYQER